MPRISPADRRLLAAAMFERRYEEMSEIAYSWEGDDRADRVADVTASVVGMLLARAVVDQGITAEKLERIPDDGLVRSVRAAFRDHRRLTLREKASMRTAVPRIVRRWPDGESLWTGGRHRRWLVELLDGCQRDMVADGHYNAATLLSAWLEGTDAFTDEHGDW